MSKKGRCQSKSTCAKHAENSADNATDHLDELVTNSNPLPALTSLSNNNLPADSMLTQKMRDKGINEDKLVSKLLELLDAKTVRYDKNGNCYEGNDYNVQLKTVEICCKIAGFESSKGATHNHLHLGKLPDGKLAELARKASDRES